ncbi:MAG: NUDIX hydrolase [Muribaculaceae bacterium]|nr:NUDIX hydrolase [Roseburia sp.]MCM1430151.1 NUDIX hydrolase [Muribaculaceae bacterium]MCM1493082.1 NUDIX hydrolase [Muribaculaceae bacterium]
MNSEKNRGVKKLTDNPFLNLYEIDARTRSGKPFCYYFASRKKEEGLKLHTHSEKAEGMAIFAITEDTPHRLIMLRQYRYPMDEYLYELPAGLIEEGESDEEAAVREMKEETGLDLRVYHGGAPELRRGFYLAQGISDELVSTVYGYAAGSVNQRLMEDTEDIGVCYVDRAEALRILQKEKLSARAGYLLIQFLHLDEENPFGFLHLSS